MEEEYNMADNVKLILPAVEIVHIKMDEVHKGMPLRDEVFADLSAVKAKVKEVKEELSSVQAAVRINIKAVSTLTSKVDKANAQGETELNVDVAIVPTTQIETEAPRAIANEVEIVDENPTSHEAPKAEVVDQIIRAGAEARDEDLPITSAADAGNNEDDDKDDDDENNDSPNLPDAGKDFGDDDDDDDEDEDDDNFTIQYQKHANATTEVSLRYSASKGEKEKETLEKNHNTKSKGKGVAEEGNLNVLFKPVEPLSTESSRLEALKAEEELRLQRQQTEDDIQLAKSLAAKVLPKKMSKKMKMSMKRRRSWSSETEKGARDV
ncbi:uncharacterized protein LOC112512864 [Cynara cardunculus var. scolymus]|uniref:uncharacterized protein LOC112512864 n=1 Tax=Cynara cardunculus var. scolymus TaxID=59895 RepID=UPI000D62D221|nr:uncharacterized protein LOC112512864 [Cynara cardunculus var. scolymus]